MDKASWKERWKNTFNRKNFLGFADKYGFSIVLFLCLCIIGATAFLTLGGKPDPRDIREKQEDESDILAENQPEDSIDITVTDAGNKDKDKEQPSRTVAPEAEQTDAGENRPVPTKEPDTEEAPAEADKEKEAAVPASAETAKDSPDMEMPAAGDILRDYAMDQLVYSPTLKEWTTHSGVDIAGAVGEEVRAALSGTVESVEEDPLKGIVITLAHENELKTVYMGLSTKDMVRTGQKVEKGQVISGIGRTAAFEITDDPHVHFEVLLDGEYQDPMEYLAVK